MRQAVILGLGTVAACAVGLGLSVLTFGGTARTEPPLPAPPPPETFAAVFEPCAHCHQIGEGARAGTGPDLNGIIGRRAATGDYPYSQAMRASGLVWDEDTLRAFIQRPSAVVPGTRMRFAGLEAARLDALMAFLADPRPDGE